MAENQDNIQANEEKLFEDLEADFADWVNELEKAEQPKVCNIDDPECEACGS